MFSTTANPGADAEPEHGGVDEEADPAAATAGTR